MQALKNENDSTFCEYTPYIQICVWIPGCYQTDGLHRLVYMSTFVYWTPRNKIHYLNTFESIAAIVHLL
jgi:hypothetical protein